MPFVPELCQQTENRMHTYLTKGPNYGKVEIIVLVSQSDNKVKDVVTKLMSNCGS
jgi:hypothetical protein